ncbi:unnamed protein product [Allacma fusca]|uniref:Uncharacterized protein n=1 Tax=Allacma fusca TaxID=39272 RepID=A0A8J2JZ30_9HEXA|nr:unnamed protein product [Allacma fusca]
MESRIPLQIATMAQMVEATTEPEGRCHRSHQGREPAPFELENGKGNQSASR